MKGFSAVAVVITQPWQSTVFVDVSAAFSAACVTVQPNCSVDVIVLVHACKGPPGLIDGPQEVTVVVASTVD